MKSLKQVSLLASLSLFVAIQARAQLPQIGVEFGGRTSTSPNPAVPGVTQLDIAGVVPQQGWNFVDNYYGPITPDVGDSNLLLDTNLLTTTVTLSFAGSDAWNDDVDPTTLTNANAELLNGTIKSTVASPTETFRFNNVPEGQYDLYLYTTVDGNGWQADAADSDNITTYYFKEWHQFYNTNKFVQARNTDPNGVRDTGNYIKFTNLGTYGRGTIGAYITKTGNVAGQNGTGVAAIELVPVGPSQANATPLSFLVQPVSRRGADGTNDVTFTAKVRGPAFSEQWYQNGTAIPGATSNTYTPNPISAATMQGAQISFKATNNLGSITSSNAILTVGALITVNGVQVLNGGKVTITQQPQNATVVAVRGGPVSFTNVATASFIGDASSAAPPIVYQWQSAPKGSSTFTAIAGATGSSYTTPVLQLTNDGTQYRTAVTASDATQNSAIAVLTVLPNTNPPVATVGAIINNSGTVEVGVSFDEGIKVPTLVQGNFALSSGTIASFKVATNSYVTYQSAILGTTGLTPGSNYVLTVHGVTDLSGNVMPSTNLSFTVPVAMHWAEIGAPPAPGQVVPVGKDGFDILNGGRKEWESYDEVDMAYVKKTNDFDVKVQVIYVEPASKWTRCGLQARNALDAGNQSDANGQSTQSTNHLFSAYAQTHVNGNQDLADTGQWPPADPVTGLPYQPGNPVSNNGHEQNQRLGAGVATTGWGSTATAPVFPNVWLRLARQGTVLHGYRSTDGVTWTDQGTTTLTDQQPDMYVGMSLSVETGNIWTTGYSVWTSPFDPTYDRLFLGQFRNFGDYAAATLPPTLSISLLAGKIVITYTGSTLQQSPKLGAAATWTAVSGAVSPYTVPAPGAAMFYRAIQ